MRRASASSSVCSTPYGITAEVTRLRVSALRLRIRCSTPYGITAEVTPRVHGAMHRLRVLNALRHHGGGHSPRAARSIAAAACSTPYGITAEVTSWRSSRTTGRRPGAQRLTASRRRSPCGGSRSGEPARVLNALRHHGGGHGGGLVWFASARNVLNALRHHGGGHGEVFAEQGNRDKCSTPYGITAEVTSGSAEENPCRSKCSTPYGITAEVTANNNKSTAQGRMCSTPYGITAEVTLRGAVASAPPARGAQRLTASRRRSHTSLRRPNQRSVGAQRLTASRRRSRGSRLRLRALDDVLNALRHHGGGHSSPGGATEEERDVLNALRHHGGGHYLR